MVAKIVQSCNFSNLVKYVLGKDDSELLEAHDVRSDNQSSMIDSFMSQSYLCKLSKPAAHISLDFSVQDCKRITDELMLEIAHEYMQRMGYGNTQYIAVRHHDRQHPHLHLVLNRVDCNGERVSDCNERRRNVKVCKDLTMHYGLYISNGKESVKRHRLRGSDAVKYKIYDALIENIPLSRSWGELQQRLNNLGIIIGFKTKGSKSQIEGVRFTMNGLTFNGSKVDRQFSYGRINRLIERHYLKTSIQNIYPPTSSLGCIAIIGGGCGSSDNKYDEEDELKKERQYAQEI